MRARPSTSPRRAEPTSSSTRPGRKAFGLWGIPRARLAGTTGRWGSWSSARTGPGTNGRIVLQPGDILLSMQHYVSTPVTVEVEEGVITDIYGSLDAQLLRQWFEQWNDPRAYHISHVGWGCDHRALWDRLGRKAHGGTDDTESFYGVMQIAFGRDTSFLGGTNNVPGAHGLRLPRELRSRSTEARSSRTASSCSTSCATGR